MPRAAAAIGISPRYASDLMAAEQTSFRSYVQVQRLERCRRDLSDPAHAARHISDIAFAWGFNDLRPLQPDLQAEVRRLAARMARAPGAVTHLPIGPACCRGTYAARVRQRGRLDPNSPVKTSFRSATDKRRAQAWL